MCLSVCPSVHVSVWPGLNHPNICTNLLFSFMTISQEQFFWLQWIGSGGGHYLSKNKPKIKFRGLGLTSTKQISPTVTFIAARAHSLKELPKRTSNDFLTNIQRVRPEDNSIGSNLLNVLEDLPPKLSQKLTAQLLHVRLNDFNPRKLHHQQTCSKTVIRVHRRVFGQGCWENEVIAWARSWRMAWDSPPL